MISIVTKSDTYKPYNKSYFNKIVLGHDRWNDYNYCTNYVMFYCDESGITHDIGYVKIYCKQLDVKMEQIEDEVNIVDYLQSGTEISYLTSDFCSLGQDLNYYHNLMRFFPREYKEILIRMRDMATDKSISDEYVDYNGVKKSLFRNGSALKAFNEAAEVIAGDIKSHDMSFGYLYSPPYANVTTDIKFDFSKKDDCFPYRVNAVVGKNGTGKTLLLTKLAEAISGSTSEFRQIQTFLDSRPSFDKVMSVSFSVFDSFRKPKDNKYCSYVYCGIQKNISEGEKEDKDINSKEDFKENKNNEHRPLTPAEIKETIKNAIAEIKEKNRYQDWTKIIEQLIGADGLKILLLQIGSNNRELHLSSGQNMLVLSMTLVIANIEKESLLLIDEPETHLHPNAIANLMRMLNMLLETYDSYAIIATHSPLVLQELPSSNIIVLDRDKDVLSKRPPVIECFGASVSNIIDDTFDVRSNESSYKTILKNALEYMSEEQVLQFFDNKLSLNAMIYLRTIAGGQV